MNRVKTALLVLALLATGRPAVGQTIEADRFRFTSGCVTSSGSGSPETVVTGSVCDIYIRTNASATVPAVYVKLSGTATNTGWVGSWPVAAGGTGLGTITSNGLLLGNGTSAMTVLSPGGANTVLTGTGAAPAFSGSPTVTNLTATSTVSALVLASPGDITLFPAGSDVLPNTNYVISLGSLSLKLKELHAAELWVETLVAQNTIATIGGRVLIAPTTVLASDLAPATTTITVKHNQMANGDRVYLEADSKVEFMAITSGAGGVAGAYTYTVTRNLDGTGANQWYAGDAVLNTGTTGKGFIDLYSTSGVLSGSGPTIVGNVRTGTTYSQIAPRWAIGNLNGLYGYAVETYGFAAGDPSGAWVKVDATNGVRLGHNLTTKIALNTTGTASFSEGAVTIDAGGITVSPSGLLAQNGYQFTMPTAGQTGIWATNTVGVTRDLLLWNIAAGGGAAGRILARTLNATGSVGAGWSIEDLDGVYLNTTMQLDVAHLKLLQGRMTIGTSFTSLPLQVYTASVANWQAGFRNDSTGHGIYVAAGSSGSEVIQAWYQNNVSTLEGIVYANGDWQNASGAWSVFSDAKVKKNVAPLSGGLDRLRQVRLREFDYTGEFGSKAGQHSIGPIADEIEAVFPRSVTVHNLARAPKRADQSADGGPTEPVKTFNPYELWMTNVQAVIELDAQVQQLRAEVKALKGGLEK